MVLLYNLGLLLYRLIVILVSPFNPKAKKWVKGRWGLIAKLRQAVGTGHKIAWFHCSSLGEFEQGRPVMEAFRKRYPHYKILLTFFSPSGYEVRKNYNGADWVFYMPLDTCRNARRFVNIVNPTIAVFVKYEFWYHYLSRLKRNGTRTYLISAIFRPDQVFFRPYGGFFRKMLKTYEHLFLQNQQSIELLVCTGVSNVTLAGDTRFDRVYELAEQAVEIPALESFRTEKPLIVAGSTWLEDEVLLVDYVNRHAEVKLVIAPHEVEEANVSQLCKQFANRKVIRYTQLSGNEQLADYDVLVVDTIGLLMSAYRYGSWAYVGGGFGKSGIHNTLEAATFRLPVVFGTNYAKFQEAFDLIALHGAFSIGSQDELNTIFDRLLTDKDYRTECGTISRRYVEQKRGATQIILDKIEV